MMQDIILLWILMCILCSQSCVSQFIEHQLCLSKCLCLPDDKIISCDKANNMRGIPTNLDPTYHRLMIQNGNFMDTYIYKINLTGLSHLTYLKVIYCKLIGVEPRAFEGMRMLKYLDLSHNNIKVLQSFTFTGLNLGELHLMENPGLQLLPDSFKGMLVESINLRSNNLKSIDFETFDGIKLQKLYLYNNRISVVEPKFSAIFNEPESLIDLTGNPLDCTCEMKWLLEFVKSKLKDHKYSTQMKTVNFTCAQPLAMTGKEIIRLSVQDLLCDAPKIKSISVSFGIPTTQLTCVAIGNRNRIPGIAWSYVEADNVRELRRNPLTKSTNGRDKQQDSLSINVTTTPDTLKAFTCTTWLEENYNEKIVVNIKSPPKFIYNSSSSGTGSNKSIKLANKNNSMKNNNNLPLPDSHFIFQKQFTILEMIGAIVGTFIITLILLMMLAQILRWWRQSQKREINYKTANIIKPFWTLGHDSNNTYSHPVSHTEYDVPRVYESHPSSICQSPPLNRVEFLDYKTLNKIYSTESSYVLS